MSEKISNENMNKVNGGMLDKDIASLTYNKDIVCPNCGASSKDDIELNKDQDILVHPQKYHCKHCGCYFDVK